MSLANELLARSKVRKEKAELQRKLNGSVGRLKADESIERDKILAVYGLTMGVLIEMTKEKNRSLTALHLRNPRAFEMFAVGALYCFDRDAKKKDLDIIDHIIKVLIKSKSTNNSINAGMIDEADRSMGELQASLIQLGEIKRERK